jgi:hypothetical protein
MTSRGKPSAPGEFDVAAAQLAGARRVLLTGLVGASVEAARTACDLAEALGVAVDFGARDLDHQYDWSSAMMTGASCFGLRMSKPGNSVRAGVSISKSRSSLSNSAGSEDVAVPSSRRARKAMPL